MVLTALISWYDPAGQTANSKQQTGFPSVSVCFSSRRKHSSGLSWVHKLLPICVRSDPIACHVHKEAKHRIMNYVVYGNQTDANKSLDCLVLASKLVVFTNLFSCNSLSLLSRNIWCLFDH